MSEEQSHHPETKPIPEGPQNGLACWLNTERLCGADCMAFADPPMAKGPDYDGKQWANCIVLVSLHQESKHATILAQHLVKQARVPSPPKTSVG